MLGMPFQAEGLALHVCACLPGWQLLRPLRRGVLVLQRVSRLGGRLLQPAWQRSQPPGRLQQVHGRLLEEPGQLLEQLLCPCPLCLLELRPLVLHLCHATGVSNAAKQISYMASA